MEETKLTKDIFSGRGRRHSGFQDYRMLSILFYLVIPTKTLEKSTLGSVYSRTLTASEIVNIQLL